jgi:hypothetical protein
MCWGAGCAWALHWLTPDAFICCSWLVGSVNHTQCTNARICVLAARHWGYSLSCCCLPAAAISNLSAVRVPPAAHARWLHIGRYCTRPRCCCCCCCCCHDSWLQVSAVLAVLLPREGLQGLPLYALGASSGGAFALTLPAYLPLKGERCKAHQFRFGTTCTQHVVGVSHACTGHGCHAGSA